MSHDFSAMETKYGLGASQIRREWFQLSHDFSAMETIEREMREKDKGRFN